MRYTGEGTGDGVVIFRIAPGTTKEALKILLQQAQELSKAHSTKSRVYRTNWKDFHNRNNNKTSIRKPRNNQKKLF